VRDKVYKGLINFKTGSL